MGTATITVPEDVKGELNDFLWVNWSEVARESFSERLRRDKAFSRFNEILKDSEMTDELAFKLANALKKKVAKRHGL